MLEQFRTFRQFQLTRSVGSVTLTSPSCNDGTAFQLTRSVGSVTHNTAERQSSRQTSFQLTRSVGSVTLHKDTRCYNRTFQLTRSVGSVTHQNGDKGFKCFISTHTLRGERDKKTPQPLPTVRISTHTLRGERDAQRATNLFRTRQFQLTRSVGSVT